MWPLLIRTALVAVFLLGGCAWAGPAPEAGPSHVPSTPVEGTRSAAEAAPTTAPSVGAAPPVPLPAGSWTKRADAPLPLTEVAAAPLSGQIWVAGGFQADGTPTDAVQVFEPAFDAWSAGPSLPEAVHHAALVSDGTRLLLIGGFAASGGFAPSAAVRILDPATGAWEDGPDLPEPRAAGGAAWDGARVVYLGGVDASGVRGEVFTLQDGSWDEIGVLATPREHLATASDGEGTTWALGGRDAGLEGNRTEVDVVVGGKVRQVGDLPTARGGVAGFHAPGVGACSAGGEGPDGTFSEVECADVRGVVTTLPPLAEARHGLGAVVLEGLAYVLLGGPEPGLTASPTVEALTLGDGGQTETR